MKRILSALLASAALATGPAIAAEIAIEGLSDIDFGQVPPTVGDLRSRIRFCVALDPEGLYRMSALGDGAAGAFELLSSAGFGAPGLRYRVYVSDRGSRGDELQPLVPSGGLRGRAPRNNRSCQPPLGSITVTVDSAELLRSRPGRYRGTLSVTVAPE